MQSEQLWEEAEELELELELTQLGAEVSLHRLIRLPSRRWNRTLHSVVTFTG